MGRADVDEILRLPCRRLDEWRALERLEGGFGERAAWLRAAEGFAILLEIHRNPKKRAAPWKPEEFLPWLERAPSGAQLRAKLIHLVKKTR